MATPAVGHPFICADETSCDWEKVTLCAFEAATSEVGRPITPNASAYLECMDAAKLPLFYTPTIPKACASSLGLNWTFIDQCFGGSRGEALLRAAASRVSSQIGSAGFHIPTVYVDGRKVCPVGKTDCDYDLVAGALGVVDDNF